jgi:hypothetical protein
VLGEDMKIPADSIHGGEPREVFVAGLGIGLGALRVIIAAIGGSTPQGGYCLIQRDYGRNMGIK